MALAAITIVFALGTLPSPAGAINVGDVAPTFTLYDLDNSPHSLSGYTGHPVLLFFLECDASVAISLAPLVESDLYRKFNSRGLYVLGVDGAGCSRDQLDQFRNTTGITYPVLQDGGIVREAYGEVTGTIVLIDGAGTVRFVARQYDEPSLSDAVEQTLREANTVLEETWGMIKDLYGR
jgi:peroxiredoxin